MILAAIGKNFRTIGISDHGPLLIPCRCNMNAEDFPSYRKEILALAEKYRSQIEVRLGLECDWLKDLQPIGFYDAFPTEYRIGSIHFMKFGKEWIPIDKSAELQQEITGRYYNGDWYAFVLDYYRNIEEMTAAGGFDILGHLDLVRKFNNGIRFYDEQAEIFRPAVARILEAAADNRIAVEINTGAVGRGFLPDPYPSSWILEECSRRSVSVLINSDAHTADKLDCFYPEAEALLRTTGCNPEFRLRN